MLALHRQLDGQLLSSRPDPEGGGAGADDRVHAPDGAVFAKPEIGHGMLAAEGGGQVLVIAVEQHRGIFRHALQNFQLGLQDALLGAQMLDVHGADVDDHRQIGFPDLRQVGHLPEMVHAHLQHGDLGILRHRQNAHGHTDVVVVVGGGLGGPEAGFQHRGDHLLGGGFAHGAGDAHHLHTDPAALAVCDLAQGDAHIVDHNGGVIPIAMLAQHRRRALFQGLGHEVVSVPGTLQGQEELSFLQFAGVVAGSQEGDLRVFGVNGAAAPVGGLL